MAQIFLFIGTILIAFQIVSDIGYLASVSALPFAYPVSITMKKVGLRIWRASRTNIGYRIDNIPKRSVRDWFRFIMWWVIFIISFSILAVITLVTQPVMIVYIVVGRTLFAINRFLNYVYEYSFAPWEIIYLVMTQRSIDLMKIISMKIFKRNFLKKRYSDKAIRRIRKKKGELPFVAFIGLVFVIAGFVLQVVSN